MLSEDEKGGEGEVKPPELEVVDVKPGPIASILAMFGIGDGKTKPQDDMPNEDRLMESDEFYTKWSGPIIIGGFVPALFATATVVGGTMTLGAWEGQCGFPLEVLMQMAVSAAYMYLLVFSWVFLGDEIKVGIILSDHKFTILTPFTSLQWLIMTYFGIGIYAFIVFIVYTALLSQSNFCAVTAPLLYKFSSFLVASFWIGFVVVISYLIKLYFGGDIASFIHDQTREHTNEEMEERIFRKVFNEYDKNREGFILADDLGNIIQGLGVYVPDDEIPTLKSTLVDGDKPDRIKFNPLYAWFVKVTKEAEELENKNKRGKKAQDSDSDAED